MNKKEKRIALKSALTSKVQDAEMIVVDKLEFEGPKTKEMAKVLENLKAGKSLVVIDGTDMNVVRSARNIPGVKTINADMINVYDIVGHKNLIVTKDAVAKIEEVYA